jgi:uncharacterized protein (TIGR02145 family)
LDTNSKEKQTSKNKIKMAKKLTIAGNTFLFTGKLTEFTREEAEAHVEAEGGKVLSGVSAKLNYLVVGEDAGSKLAKAEALGAVTILHEKEFLELMKPSSTGADTKPKDSNKAGDKSKANKAVSNNQTNLVTIGKQVWMTRNLDVTHFKNGDPIPEAKTDKQWEEAGLKRTPAWCYFKNKASNGAEYGVLYNFYALKDPRGIAPDGFHIPTSDEWNTLIKSVGGKKVGGKKIKVAKENGTDDFHFAGLGGGHRDFMGFGASTSYWWTSTPNPNAMPGIDSAYAASIGKEDDDISIGAMSMNFGNSIRCIKD